LDKPFSVYPGKWPCKKCGIEVTLLRYWPETGDATWMCLDKHISKVNLLPPRKRKKDFKV
jgi:hypothetical protein